MNTQFYNTIIIEIDRDYLHYSVDSIAYKIKWENCSDKLSKASMYERGEIEVSPSGYGLHWHLLDEDLAIKPLLALSTKTNQQVLAN